MRISDWSSDVCSSDLSPKVYFMHIGGTGQAESLAAGVKEVWDAIRAVRAARPQPATGFGGDTPVPGGFDADALAIGRESCRERVSQSVLYAVVAVSLKKTSTYDTLTCSTIENQ